MTKTQIPSLNQPADSESRTNTDMIQLHLVDLFVQKKNLTFYRLYTRIASKCRSVTVIRPPTLLLAEHHQWDKFIQTL